MNQTPIVIVEDELLLYKDIERRLKKIGYTDISIFTNGQEALSYIIKEKPGLVLMDIQIEGEMDGIEVAEKIRPYNIPVVFLSGHTEDYLLERAKVTEPYGYVLKPFNDREIEIAVSVALYRSNVEDKLREKEEWISSILNNIGDGIIVTDVEGRVTYMNPAAETIAGWSFNTVKNEKFERIIQLQDEENRPFLDSLIDKVLRKPVPVSLSNALLLGREGKQVSIDCSASPLMNNQDVVSGVVLGFRSNSRSPY